MALIQNNNVKFFLTQFLFAGLTFAGLMAGFNYYEGDSFSIWRFGLHAISFGSIMGGLEIYRRRKKSKKEEIKS